MTTEVLQKTWDVRSDSIRDSGKDSEGTIDLHVGAAIISMYSGQSTYTFANVVVSPRSREGIVESVRDSMFDRLAKTITR